MDTTSSPSVAGDLAGAAPSEWADVRRAVDGDGEAYARLVRCHQQTIANYMWRFTRQRAAWEELVQDVFVEAYLSLRSYRGRAPLVHWLRKIATRVGYRYWKRRLRERAEKRVPLEANDCPVAVPDDDSDPERAAERIHAVLEQLAPRDRLVLTLFYLEENAVAQIAELTGWTQTMVKVQLHRARGRLRRLLEKAEAKG
jgi:RNA polymerase sigma-70 factor (ECF subfamily)